MSEGSQQVHHCCTQGILVGLHSVSGRNMCRINKQVKRAQSRGCACHIVITCSKAEKSGIVTGVKIVYSLL
jgi:hypothetical protein